MVYLLIALAALVLTAFFAGSETGFISTSRIRLQSMAAEGDERTRRIDELLGQPDTFLSIVLIGTNIMVTVYSSFFTICLRDRCFNEWQTLLLTTGIVLVTGEILPKSLFREYPYRLSLKSVSLINISYYLLFPLIKITSAFTRFLNRFDRTPDDPHDLLHSRQTIMQVLREGHRIGVVEPEEHEIINKVLSFRDIPVKRIMTPRYKIRSLSHETTLDHLRETFIETGYSRIPVYKGSPDNIIGVFNAFDLLTTEEIGDTEDLIKPVYFVSGDKRCDHLLEEMKNMKNMMAVVRDGDDAITGMVTMEDLLETLVGDIQDEHDT